MGADRDLVGRDPDLSAVRSAVAAVLARRGGALAFAGDPGVGKSSVLDRLATAAVAAAVPMFAGSAGGRTLRRAGADPEPARRPVRWSELAAAVGAEDGPAVVVVDDFHLATRHQVSVLADLVAWTADRPLLVGLAYRPRQLPTYAAAAVPRATMAGHLDVRPLEPLPVGHAHLVVPGHPDPVRLHERAQGNPQYMRLLADPSAEAAGPIRAELARLGPDEWVVAQVAAASPGPIPIDLLVAVSELDDTTTRAALDGLLGGDVLRQPRPALVQFRHPVVARIAHADMPLTRRRAVHHRMESELRRRGATATLRAPHAMHAADPGCGEHIDTLVTAAAEVLYTRTETAIAWLETAGALLSADDDRLSHVRFTLARAYLLSGRLVDSRELLRGLSATGRHTADAAMDLSATSTWAELHLGRYREAEAVARDGLTGADHRHPKAAVLLTGIAELSAVNSAYTTAVRYTAAAATLARQHGDRVAEASALGEAAFARINIGDVAGAAEAVAAAARLVDAGADAAIVENLPSLHQLGLAELLLERFDDAQRHLVRGVRLAHRTGQRYVLPLLLKALGEGQFRQGRLTEALATLDQVAYYDPDGLQPASVLATVIRAQVLAQMRPGDDPTECHAAVDRVLSATAGRTWSWVVPSRCNAADALVISGAWERGRQVLLDAAGGAGLPHVAPVRTARMLETLTITALARGDAAAAAGHLARAEADPTPATAGRRGYTARTRIRVGLAHQSAERFAAAADEALASFRTAWMPVEICRTHLAVATAKLDADDHSDVAEHLGAATALADEYGAGQFGREARRQLARLPGDADTGWRTNLTPREAEIAELAGGGMSSREIGRRLYLSIRTVDSHLGRVYQKLDLPNRVALAGVVKAGPAGSPR